MPLVIGCGPIGLAVILALKARGIGPIVASDFSARRRALAEKLGADIVVDPAVTSPYSSWAEVAGPPGYRIDSLAVRFGFAAQARPCVVFECVGVPGLIQQIMQSAPARSRVIVVGVCMETDKIEPALVMTKEMNVHFAFGYSKEEFTHTLHSLADGTIDGANMITGTVKMDGVAGAFEALRQPDEHAKIMVTFD